MKTCGYTWKTLDQRYVGKRYGDLTVLARAPNVGKHSAWLCHCDCGNEKAVLARYLVRGYTLSCGCRRALRVGKSKVVVPGDRFGHLEAMKHVGFKGRNAVFLWRCDCGVEKEISANAVKRGDVKSCGCFRRQHCIEMAALLPGRDGKAALRHFFKDYVTRCRVRGIHFGLDLPQFEALAKGVCSYCGSPPVPTGRKRYGWFALNGIDRIDSATGYTPENVCSCCMTCNTAKSTMTVVQFKDWVRRVFGYLGLV